jgi:hypothetical protein
MLAIVFAAFLLLWLPYSVYFLVNCFDNRGSGGKKSRGRKVRHRPQLPHLLLDVLPGDVICGKILIIWKRNT